jgi:hypothetical protein
VTDTKITLPNDVYVDDRNVILTKELPVGRNEWNDVFVPIGNCCLSCELRLGFAIVH